MKRILIIANTYYQMILAIHMKNTIYKNDELVLLLSDHSQKADQICEKIRNLGVFADVKYIETKKLYMHEKLQDKIMGTALMTLSKYNSFSLILRIIDNQYFDEIISYSIDQLTDSCFCYLSVYNPQIKISQFEEGILSYSGGYFESKRRKLVSKLRKYMRKPTIEQSYDKFYCYFPEIYSGRFQTVKIPGIVIGSDTSKMLEKVFNVCDCEKAYLQKYIFFTSVYDFEGGKAIGEYELVCAVADLVGKNNILIKTHPRDIRTIYQDNGFCVDNNSAIPWEAIQLAGDFSDKVFLTVNSCSVLSGSTMSENPIKTYYLYKLCDIQGNQSCLKTAKDIENLLNNQNMKRILKNVFVAEKLVDILI